MRRPSLVVGLILFLSVMAVIVFRCFTGVRAFSIHCSDLFLSEHCLQGEIKNAPFYEPDELSLLLFDAFPKESGKYGRDSFDSFFAMFYRPGEHALRVEERCGYWLLFLDGAIHGAAAFSKEGLTELAGAAFPITSLSLYFDASATDWDRIGEIQSLRIVLGGGASAVLSARFLESGVIYFDQARHPFPWDQALPRRFLYHVAVNSPKPSAPQWREIVGNIRPVSLNLRFPGSSDGLRMRCTPTEKEEMLEVLRGIPDSVRFLSVSFTFFWDAHQEIVNTLSRKQSIRTLSLQFSERTLAQESTLLIDCGNLSSLSLTFETIRESESADGPGEMIPAHPEIWLWGSPGRMRVLSTEGGRLCLDAPLLSAVWAFHGVDTLLIGNASPYQSGFLPRIVEVEPRLDWTGPGFRQSVERYGEILSSAQEIRYSEELVTLTGIASFSAVKRAWLSLGEEESSSPVYLDQHIAAFPNVEEMFLLVSCCSWEQVVRLDASDLRATKLWIAVSYREKAPEVQVLSRPPGLQIAVVFSRFGGHNAVIPSRLLD